MSTAERERQLAEYLKQFDPKTYLHDLNQITHKDPPPHLKKSRKEYSKLEVEKILHRREIKNDVTGLPKFEYCVLWKSLSYLHSEWISEDRLEQDPQGRPKLKRFLKKQPPLWTKSEDSIVYDPSWATVDRILAGRPGPGYFDGDTRFEYLVKFEGLNYMDARWEFPDDFNNDRSIVEFQRRSVLPPNVWAPKFRPTSYAWKAMTNEENVFKDENKLHEWQIEGVDWLTFNWYNHRGSILADEMGLGKTVQVVASLKRISAVYCPGPFLIVAPLGTVQHWKRETEGWTDLNPVVYQGKKEDRRVNHFFEFRYFDKTGRRLVHNNAPYKFNVLICTYESVMLDDEINKIPWKVCVVDEAHRLKNIDSKLSRFLQRCNIEHRMLLTGTPIQNNLRELWNLLNFVSPHSFSDYHEMEHQFGSGTVENDNDLQELHKLIKPYFLRRVKEDVAKFIPQKQETIIEVELTRIQKQYYRAILERNREFLNRGITSSKNAPKLMNIAMQLRKICNHPYLIEGVIEKVTAHCKEKEDYLAKLVETAGKFVLLDKLLPKLHTDGHKVLIFSQMRMTLDLLQTYLFWKGYPFERIDGCIQGNDRQAAIDRFCAPDSDSFVFLLSTRAGGVGINLTAADTVIIYDSDWNPQNDIQAMARCHRIGQSKEVKVYRLITARSYEKEMFIRASKKLGLGKAIMGTMASELNSFLSGDNTSGKERHTTEEINSWLKHGAYDLFREGDDEADKFCAADIEKILNERATDIVIDEHTGQSTFSKATFVSTDAAAGIDMNDEGFWDKILPVQLNPQEMLKQIRVPDALVDDDARDEFWDNLDSQVQEVLDLRSRGMLAEVHVIISLLAEVANLDDIFSLQQRAQAQDWANFIENPRRARRQQQRRQEEGAKAARDGSNARRKMSLDEIDRFYGIADEDDPRHKRKMNIFGHNGMSKKACDSIVESFLDIYATLKRGREFWNAIYDHIDLKKKRTMREIFAWIVAFLIHLSRRALDAQHHHVFRSVAEMIKTMLPHSFSDDMEVDEASDDDYTPSMSYREREKMYREKMKSKKVTDPSKVMPDNFPSLHEKFFESMITDHSRRWGRRLRLSLLLRRRLVGISIDGIREDITIPDSIPGDLPTKWWTPEDDISLIIGAAKHGVENWEGLRLDTELSFCQKCLLADFDPDNKNETQITDMCPATCDPSKEGYKCCGQTHEGLLLVCDRCNYSFHGECLQIFSPEQIPLVWMCFRCAGNWPKARVIYERLATVLNHMKGGAPIKPLTPPAPPPPRPSFQPPSEISGRGEFADGNGRSASNGAVPWYKKSKAEKRASKYQRMWEFTNKELHRLQRAIQMFGLISAQELKEKAQSMKTDIQIEMYCASLMGEVEYTVRTERLKDLIKDGKVDLPPELEQRFIKYRTQQQKKRGAIVKPISTTAISPPPASDVTLGEECQSKCVEMLRQIMEDESTRNLFGSRHNHNPEESATPDGDDSKLKDENDIIQTALDFTDLIARLESNKYSDPQTLLDDINLVLDSKLAHHPQDDTITQQADAVRAIVDLCKTGINVAHNPSKTVEQPSAEPTPAVTTNPLPPTIDPNVASVVMGATAAPSQAPDVLGMPPPLEAHDLSTPSTQLSSQTNSSSAPSERTGRNGRLKLLKSDLDLLTDDDFGEFFGLKKQEVLFDHHMTPQLAWKIWRRVQMWCEFRRIEDFDESVLEQLYKYIKTDRNQPGTSISLPEWYFPIKHDRMIVQLVMKHGLGSINEMMQETIFLDVIEQDQPNQIKFFKKFLLDKKPIVYRLRYVGYVLANNGTDPQRNYFREQSLEDVLRPWVYPQTRTMDDYENEFHHWVSEQENRASDRAASSTVSALPSALAHAAIPFQAPVRQMRRVPFRRPSLPSPRKQPSFHELMDSASAEPSTSVTEPNRDVAMKDVGLPPALEARTGQTEEKSGPTVAPPVFIDMSGGSELVMPTRNIGKEEIDDTPATTTTISATRSRVSVTPPGTSSSSSSAFNRRKNLSVSTGGTPRSSMDQPHSASSNMSGSGSGGIGTASSDYNTAHLALGDPFHSFVGNVSYDDYGTFSLDPSSYSHTPLAAADGPSRFRSQTEYNTPKSRPKKSSYTAPTRRRGSRGGGSKVSGTLPRYRAIERDATGKPITPFVAKGGCTITSVGAVVYDRKGFCSSKYIWPVGYESQRMHPSMINPDERVLFTSRILDGGDKPLFEVTPDDDPNNPIVSASASASWTTVIKKVAQRRTDAKRRKTMTVSGPEMFGYSDPVVKALVEELPDAERCTDYFKHNVPFRERFNL